MRKLTAAATMMILLTTVAGPTDAQESERSELCLVVESPAGVTLDDPAAIQAALASGSISVVAVVPCASGAPGTSEDDDGSADTGAWVVGELGEAPESGAPTAAAFLEATSGTSSHGNPILLAIRCVDYGQNELLIDWDDDLGGGYSLLVETMLGDGAVEPRDWVISTTGTATFFPDAVVPFVRSMLDQTWFVAKTTLPDGTTTTGVFYLWGIDEALRNVREACRW